MHQVRIKEITLKVVIVVIIFLLLLFQQLLFQNYSIVPMTDKVSTAPGGSKMFVFFKDVEDFRTNLLIKYHQRSVINTSLLLF